MFVLALGCGGQRAQTILSLQDVGCASCGAQSIEALKKAGGVYDVAFNQKAVELKISFDAGKTSPESLKNVVSGLGYKCAIGAGKGSYETEAALPKDADIKTLAGQGGALEIKDHLVKGKVTVFDFYAVWCGPCREVDRAMKEIVAKADDVAYRRIDIDKWESAVSKKYLGKVPELPYVVIYGKNGKELAKISGLNLVRLRTTIEKGRKQ